MLLPRRVRPVRLPKAAAQTTAAAVTGWEAAPNLPKYSWDGKLSFYNRLHSQFLLKVSQRLPFTKIPKFRGPY